MKILLCRPLFIYYRSSGEKLTKYQANTSCVIMFNSHYNSVFKASLLLLRSKFKKNLLCRPYSVTIEVDSGEKFTKYQANSSCVIMSVILMTTTRRNLILITLRV